MLQNIRQIARMIIITKYLSSFVPGITVEELSAQSPAVVSGNSTTTAEVYTPPAAVDARAALGPGMSSVK